MSWSPNSGTNKPPYTRDQVVDMNVQFAQAMLSARKKGLEHFTIGVIVDDTPFSPQTLQGPPPRHSYMQSSAALCAENAPGVI